MPDKDFCEACYLNLVLCAFYEPCWRLHYILSADASIHSIHLGSVDLFIYSNASMLYQDEIILKN